MICRKCGKEFRWIETHARKKHDATSFTIEEMQEIINEQKRQLLLQAEKHLQNVLDGTVGKSD